MKIRTIRKIKVTRPWDLERKVVSMDETLDSLFTPNRALVCSVPILKDFYDDASSDVRMKPALYFVQGPVLYKCK